MPNNKEYQKKYRKLRPRSATTPEHYRYYLFLLTLTDDELQMLYKKRMIELKYALDEEKQKIKTEMLLIQWVKTETIDEYK